APRPARRRAGRGGPAGRGDRPPARDAAVARRPQPGARHGAGARGGAAHAAAPRSEPQGLATGGGGLRGEPARAGPGGAQRPAGLGVAPGPERVHRARQARDPPGGVVAVEHALGHRAVERTARARERLGRGADVAAGDRLADAAHEVPALGLDRLIAPTPLLALAVTLERRGMIRHGGPSVTRARRRINRRPSRAARAARARWHRARRASGRAPPPPTRTAAGAPRDAPLRRATRARPRPRGGGRRSSA